MKTTAWLVTGALLMYTATLAADTNPYSGTWHLSTVSKKGKSREGTVVLKDLDGTWKTSSINVKNPCTGMLAPLIIKEASSERLVFEIAKSKALRGCEDSTATLKRVNETTLQGELDDGRKLTLVRE